MKPSVIRSLAASLSSRPSARADTIAGTARLAAPAASANRRRDSFASLFIASPPDLVAPKAGATPASHRPSLTRPLSGRNTAGPRQHLCWVAPLAHNGELLNLRL